MKKTFNIKLTGAYNVNASFKMLSYDGLFRISYKLEGRTINFKFNCFDYFVCMMLEDKEKEEEMTINLSILEKHLVSTSLEYILTLASKDKKNRDKFIALKYLLQENEEERKNILRSI